MKVNERISNLTVGNEVVSASSQNIEIIILMIMLSVFSIVGSVGNGMVIFVFQRVRDKSTAQVFIISMAVIDLFTCMVIMPMTMFMEYTEYDIKFDLLCKLYNFLITSKIPMSAFIMVAIAFDRYFCICYPFARIITLSRARNIVIYLALLACFFGVVTSLFYGVYQVVERIDSKRIDDAMGTNFTKSVAKVDNTVTLDNRSTLYNEIRQLLIATIKARNYTFNGMGSDYLPTTTEIVYIGVCSPSSVILGTTLFHAYQRTYMAVYPLCLIAVMILYFMIYRFMCVRRSKKLQQKLMMCSYVNGDGTFENTRLVSGDVEETRRDSRNKEQFENSNHEHYSPAAAGTNGVSPASVGVRTSHERKIKGSVRKKQGTERRCENLLVVSATCGRMSSSSAVTTTAVTPTDNDDNMPMLSFYENTTASKNTTTATCDRELLVTGRKHSHLAAQKYQWHKSRDSMKRYKGKSRRRKSEYSYDADRLREENRSANVRTALMLFTVTLVFMVAFVPAWIMAHRLIPHSATVFYLYFSYNVANPFIYAFMNHIFKDYMRKVFTCRTADAQRRAS